MKQPDKVNDTRNNQIVIEGMYQCNVTVIFSGEWNYR